MGFIKDIAGIAGIGAGVYLGGIIELAGTVVGSDSIEQFGEKVLGASAGIGDKLGNIAENVVDTSVNAARNAMPSYPAEQNTLQLQNNHKIEKALDVFDD